MERNGAGDAVVQRLDAILDVMQNVLIIEGARAGMSKAEVREMVGVGDARVSGVWRHLNLSERGAA
jgi:hypothetical protein